MEIEIQGRKIGDDHPTFFIAEAGVNHNGSLDLALQLVDVAAEAGADAVKFQTFKTEKIITRDAPKSTYHIQTTGGDKKQTWFELLKTQELSSEMHRAIISRCKEKNIIFLSTPYDEESADLLYDLGVPAYKTASTDTNNTPLLRHMARKGNPMIISTAMSDMSEVELAVAAVRAEGLNDIVVTQCTGNYPSRLKDSNLRVMKTYREKMNCLVGYSDHTPELINPVAATALGACVYEKHFTLDKSLPGPDHRMSLNPEGLAETIDYIRKTESVLGSSYKQVLPDEKENQGKLRKSLIPNIDLHKGEVIKVDMVSIKRPGFGLAPDRYEDVIGKTVSKEIKANVPLQYDDIIWEDK